MPQSNHFKLTLKLCGKKKIPTMLPYPILSTLLKSPLGNGKKIRRENKLRVSPRHFVLIENIETRCFSLARNSFSFPFVPSFSGGMNNC